MLDAPLAEEIEALASDGLLAREGDRVWIPAELVTVGNYVFERVAGARFT